MAWRPRGTSLRLLEDVQAVFDEYADYLPLTCRQVYYRLVGRYGYAKGTGFEKQLGHVLYRARKSRQIPFDWIRDDGMRGWAGEQYALDEVESPEEYLGRQFARLRDAWQSYAIPVNSGQPYRLELWCEAAGMMPQLERVAADYRVPVFSGGGAVSITGNYDLAKRCARQPELPTVVLHVGDHDVDGDDLWKAIRGDVLGYLAEDAPEVEVEVVRLAVTPAQIADLGLVTAPVKPSTNKTRQSRITRWFANGYDETAQAEAIPPDRLAVIVRDAIESYVDFDVLAELRRQEQAGRDWLRGEIEKRFA